MTPSIWLGLAVAMLALGPLVLGLTGRLPGVLPYALSFAAGNFLYVAMADLIPHLHRGGHAGHGHAAIGVDRSAWRQVVLIGLGIATMVLL